MIRILVIVFFKIEEEIEAGLVQALIYQKLCNDIRVYF
jgi:hypothetical protein